MKKYFLLLALGMILLAAAHSLITEESVMHSVIFALSPLAFLRIVYYLKKFSGDDQQAFSQNAFPLCHRQYRRVPGIVGFSPIQEGQVRSQTAEHKYHAVWIGGHKDEAAQKCKYYRSRVGGKLYFFIQQRLHPIHSFLYAALFLPK